MAIDNDAADSDAENGEEGKKTGGKRLLLIIVLLVLLLGGAGAGAYFGGLLGGGGEGGEEEEHAAEEESDAHGGGHGGGHGEGGETAATGQPLLDEHGKPKLDEHGNPMMGPLYYEMPEFLVNLSTTGKKVSFLKMKVTLEVENAAVVAALDANKPRVQDAFNTYLRELRASDLSGSAGIYRLREELLTRVNQAIHPQQVKDILFSQIIVQ